SGLVGLGVALFRKCRGGCSVRAHSAWSLNVFLVVATAIGITVGLFGSSVAEAAETLRIGTSLVLEGTAAEYGISSLRGVQIAVDQINAAGGINGRLIELVVEDTHGRSEEHTSELQSRE